MRNPVVHIPRPLKPAAWKRFLENVPGINPEVLQYVYPGPDLEFITQLEIMDVSKFRVFELGEAVAVLKVLVDHWILKRFAGPYPFWVTHLNGERMDYCPMFCVPKPGDSPTTPKKRCIFNAAATHPLPVSKQVMDRVMSHDFANDRDFRNFQNSRFIRTLNQNLIKKEVSFTRVSDIVRGLYRCKLIWKLDLSRGFRHIIRRKRSWRYTCMTIRIRHPVTGDILEFKTVDVTASMGISNSPAWF